MYMQMCANENSDNLDVLLMMYYFNLALAVQFIIQIVFVCTLFLSLSLSLSLVLLTGVRNVVYRIVYLNIFVIFFNIFDHIIVSFSRMCTKMTYAFWENWQN